MVETHLKQIQDILKNEEQNGSGRTKVRTTYLLKT